MIIACGICGQRYEVNEAKIPASGAMITCRQCSNKITVHPPDAEIIPLASSQATVGQTVVPSSGGDPDEMVVDDRIPTVVQARVGLDVSADAPTRVVGLSSNPQPVTKVRDDDEAPADVPAHTESVDDAPAESVSETAIPLASSQHYQKSEASSEGAAAAVESNQDQERSEDVTAVTVAPSSKTGAGIDPVTIQTGEIEALSRSDATAPSAPASEQSTARAQLPWVVDEAEDEEVTRVELPPSHHSNTVVEQIPPVDETEEGTASSSSAAASSSSAQNESAVQRIPPAFELPEVTPPPFMENIPEVEASVSVQPTVPERNITGVVDVDELFDLPEPVLDEGADLDAVVQAASGVHPAPSLMDALEDAEAPPAPPAAPTPPAERMAGSESLADENPEDLKETSPDTIHLKSDVVDALKTSAVVTDGPLESGSVQLEVADADGADDVTAIVIDNPFEADESTQADGQLPSPASTRQQSTEQSSPYDVLDSVPNDHEASEANASRGLWSWPLMLSAGVVLLGLSAGGYWLLTVDEQSSDTVVAEEGSAAEPASSKDDSESVESAADASTVLEAPPLVLSSSIDAQSVLSMDRALLKKSLEAIDIESVPPEIRDAALWGAFRLKEISNNPRRSGLFERLSRRFVREELGPMGQAAMIGVMILERKLPGARRLLQRAFESDPDLDPYHLYVQSLSVPARQRASLLRSALNGAPTMVQAWSALLEQRIERASQRRRLLKDMKGAFQTTQAPEFKTEILQRLLGIDAHDDAIRWLEVIPSRRVDVRHLSASMRALFLGAQLRRMLLKGEWARMPGVVAHAESTKAFDGIAKIFDLLWLASPSRVSEIDILSLGSQPGLGLISAASTSNILRANVVAPIDDDWLKEVMTSKAVVSKLGLVAQARLKTAAGLSNDGKEPRAAVVSRAFHALDQGDFAEARGALGRVKGSDAKEHGLDIVKAYLANEEPYRMLRTKAARNDAAKHLLSLYDEVEGKTCSAERFKTMLWGPMRFEQPQRWMLRRARCLQGEEAAQSYASWLETQPENSLLYYGLVALHVDAGDLEQAITWAKKWSQAQPDSRMAVFALARLHSFKSDRKAAAEVLEPWIHEEARARSVAMTSLYTWARLSEPIAETPSLVLDNARQWLLEATSEDASIEALFLLGLVESARGRHLSAINAFERILKTRQWSIIEETAPEQTELLFIELARSRLAAGQAEKVADTLAQGIQGKAPNAVVLELLGDASLALRERANARRYYRRALGLSTHPGVGLLLKAARLESNETRVRSLLEKAIEEEPSSAEPYYELGVLAQELGERAAALQAWDTFLKLAASDHPLRTDAEEQRKLLIQSE